MLAKISRRSALQLGAASLLTPVLVRAASSLVRNPYLQNVQGQQASILWATSESGDAKAVVFAPDGSTKTVQATTRLFTAQETKLAGPVYQHQADFSNLEAATSYTYRVELNGQALTQNAGQLRTPGAGNFSFLAFGDSGLSTPEQRTMTDLMVSEKGVSFALHTGDLVYPEGGFEQYNAAYFGINATLMDRLPFFPVLGNHDCVADSGTAYLALHSVPDSGINPADKGRYYSFDWGDVHFCSIDTNLLPGEASARMLDWFENDLRSTRQFWKVVFFHHPPYPTGHHKDDPICALVRRLVVPIIDSLGVQLVLNGHEHGYEKSFPLIADGVVESGTGTQYIITGGGGADLHEVGTLPQTALALQTHNYLRIDVEATTLTVRAIGIKGSEFDRIVIQPKPILRVNGIVNIGDNAPGLAPGSLASIYGQNLALNQSVSRGFPLPTELGKVAIRVGGIPAPLLYVSPGQVNFQIPYDTAPDAKLEFSTTNGKVQTTLTLKPTAPAIIVVTMRDKSASAANAPKSGDLIVVYATGLGFCSKSVSEGSAAAPLNETLKRVDVMIGDLRVQPLFAGLTAGFAGLYQVNLALPQSLRPGTYALRLVTEDGSSRSVPLLVV